MHHRLRVFTVTEHLLTRTSSPSSLSRYIGLEVERPFVGLLGLVRRVLGTCLGCTDVPSTSICGWPAQGKGAMIATTALAMFRIALYTSLTQGQEVVLLALSSTSRMLFYSHFL